MKIPDLIELCRDNEHVILVLPRPKTWRGSDKVRLAVRGGPFGHINNVKESKDGKSLEVCATFKSAQILRWLKQMGQLGD